MKYYYEPTGTWHTVSIGTCAMKVGSLRAAVFRQKFPHLAFEERYMDAVQVYYTQPYIQSDTPTQ